MFGSRVLWLLVFGALGPEPAPKPALPAVATISAVPPTACASVAVRVAPAVTGGPRLVAPDVGVDAPVSVSIATVSGLVEAPEGQGSAFASAAMTTVGALMVHPATGGGAGIFSGPAVQSGRHIAPALSAGSTPVPPPAALILAGLPVSGIVGYWQAEVVCAAALAELAAPPPSGSCEIGIGPVPWVEGLLAATSPAVRAGADLRPQAMTVLGALSKLGAVPSDVLLELPNFRAQAGLFLPRLQADASCFTEAFSLAATCLKCVFLSKKHELILFLAGEVVTRLMYRLKQGDSGIKLVFYLKKRDNTPFDLANSVVTLVLKGGSPPVRISRTCSVDSPAAGICSYVLTEEDTASVGKFRFELTVDKVGGRYTTITDAQLLIEERL